MSVLDTGSTTKNPPPPRQVNYCGPESIAETMLYTGSLPSHFHCSNDDWCWHIQAQSDDKVVVAEIIDMDIEASINCGADRLQFKDGKF